jgi:hypothetical protein
MPLLEVSRYCGDIGDHTGLPVAFGTCILTPLLYSVPTI